MSKNIVWLYPTSMARKSHAFVGPRLVNDPSLGDDVEQGKQSLCRNYGRFASDHGWVPPHGGFPADACAQCERRALKR